LKYLNITIILDSFKIIISVQTIDHVFKYGKCLIYPPYGSTHFERERENESDVVEGEGWR